MTSFDDKYNLHEERDPEAWKFYKQQRAQQWNPEETVLSEDKNCFNGLSTRKKSLIEDLVAFFAPGDGLVCQQILHLMMETEDFAQRCFLGEQFSVEVVHARAYKDIILTFFNGEEQDRIFKSVDSLPCVREKAVFVEKYMENKSLPRSLRYVAAAVSEGVFFVSLFAIIFYLREKKLMNRFCFLNEQVSKDEKLHRDFDILMASRGRENQEFTEEQAREIVEYGINVEIEHVKYILRDPIDSEEIDALGGMTVDNMTRYIKTLGDQIMHGMGFQKCFTYSSKDASMERFSSGDRVEEYSPPWMVALSMNRKANFYELPVGNYTAVSSQKTDEKDRNNAFTDPSLMDL